MHPTRLLVGVLAVVLGVADLAVAPELTTPACVSLVGTTLCETPVHTTAAVLAFVLLGLLALVAGGRIVYAEVRSAG